MDVASLATLLLMALVLAAQPWSVLAAIILVTTRGGVLKESAYAIGWIIALSVVLLLTIAFAPVDTTGKSSTTAAAVIEIVLGLAALGVLAVRWRRPVAAKSGAPSWLARLDSMPWFFALVLGAFLPNYIVVVAAGNELMQAGLTGAGLAAAAVGFVLVASVGVAAPLGVLIFRHSRAEQIYASWREWILGHSRSVTYGTGLLVVVVLIGKGIVGLLR